MEANQALFADFATHEDADRAVRALEEMGYKTSDISVIAKESSGKTTTTTATGETAKGALGGATTGGVIGGIAGLLAGVGVVPAIAGILIGGPVAAALGLAGVAATTVSGVVTGAVAGGLIGALTKFGLSKEDAGYYNGAVEEGRVVLGVPVGDENEEEVRDLLDESYAQDVKSEPTSTHSMACENTAEAMSSNLSSSNKVLGRVRLVKHVITENVKVNIPLKREVLQVEDDSDAAGQ